MVLPRRPTCCKKLCLSLCLQGTGFFVRSSSLAESVFISYNEPISQQRGEALSFVSVHQPANNHWHHKVDVKFSLLCLKQAYYQGLWAGGFKWEEGSSLMSSRSLCRNTLNCSKISLAPLLPPHSSLTCDNYKRQKLKWVLILSERCRLGIQYSVCSWCTFTAFISWVSKKVLLLVGPLRERWSL